MTISTGSDAGLFDMDLGRLNDISFDFSNSSFDNQISFNDLKIDEEITLTDSEFELDKEALIDMDADVIVLDKSEYVEPENMNLDMMAIHDLSKTEKINILEDIIDINGDVISFSESSLQPITELASLDFLQYISKSFQYTKTIDGDLDMVLEYSLSNSEFTDLHEFNINKPISFSSNLLVNESLFDYNLSYSDMYNLTSTFDETNFNLNLDYKTIHNLTSTHNENNFDSTITYDEMYNLTSTHNENNFDLNLNQINIHDFSDSEFIQDREGVIDNKVIIGNNKDLSLTWGTTTNDTHFVNFQETLPLSRRNKGANGDYNVDYYEDRFNFISIGDSSILSSSFNDGGNSFVDFENHKFILNERVHTDGRPIGATHKISASADGVITYPINHFVNLGTSKLSIRHSFYIGSKNTGLNSRQFPHKLDVQPSSSFYTINVGGSDTDTILRVEKPGDRTKT